MTINPTQPGGIRSSLTPEAVEGPKTNPPTAKPGAAAEDQVEISAEARALAAQGDPERVPFTGARLAEIRALVAQGHFDTPEMADRLARRLLESGDL